VVQQEVGALGLAGAGLSADHDALVLSVPQQDGTLASAPTAVSCLRTSAWSGMRRRRWQICAGASRPGACSRRAWHIWRCRWGKI